MSTTPKVSVIIPVYNVEDYLRQCLDSVINQTLKDIEIICVDDGSTDNSLQILREYEQKDSRVKVLTQKNQYAGVARNTGMNIARGHYYVFLDSDDFFENDLLELEYEQCKSYNADICLCAANKYDITQKRYFEMPSWLNEGLITCDIMTPQALGSHLYQITSACPWTKMFRAEFIKSNHLLFQALPRANDVYFVLSALGLARRIVAVKKTLIHYRVGNASSLQATNRVTPTMFLNALLAVKERLNIGESSLQLQQAFFNVAMEHVAYNLRSLEKSTDPETFEKSLQEIKQIYNKNLFIPGLAETYFFNKNDYNYLCKLKVIEKNIDISVPSAEKFISNNTNKNTPTISFVVPVYNSGKYLNECLESLLNQTYRNIEVVCVDDCSTDNSCEILNEFASKDSRMHVFTHQINKHAGGARNTGLEHACGQYVWFIDSDDYIDLNAGSRLLELLKQNSKIDVLAFNADAFSIVNGKKQNVPGGIKRNWPCNEIIDLPKDVVRVPDTIEGSSVTYIAKREFIDHYRFRENIAFEDADFSFKVFSGKGTFYHIDYAPYHRRITEGSVTGKGARGENPACIIGRLIAAKEISKIIQERRFEAD